MRGCEHGFSNINTVRVVTDIVKFCLSKLRFVEDTRMTNGVNVAVIELDIVMKVLSMFALDYLNI